MSSAAVAGNRTRNIRRRLAKSVILLVISLGLFVFSGEFSPASIFEPESMGWKFWVSYANDFMLPFALYFFLCLGERWLKTWQARGLLAFAIPTLLEFGQLLYYRVLSGHYVGSFDPIDILMYAIAVGLAILIDQKVFPKLFAFW